MKVSANLAARPFRNLRLPGLLIALAAVGLALLTLLHLASLSRVLPQNTSALHQQANQLQTEADRYRRDILNSPAASIDGPTEARWSVLKNIVDRRVFDWPGLLARLEGTLPADIRLTAITPRQEGERVELVLEGLGRSLEDVYAFGRNLEAQGFFANATPVDFATEENFQRFTYRVEYRPQGAPAPAAPPGPELSAAPEGTE